MQRAQKAKAKYIFVSIHFACMLLSCFFGIILAFKKVFQQALGFFSSIGTMRYNGCN